MGSAFRAACLLVLLFFHLQLCAALSKRDKQWVKEVGETRALANKLSRGKTLSWKEKKRWLYLGHEILKKKLYTKICHLFTTDRTQRPAACCSLWNPYYPHRDDKRFAVCFIRHIMWSTGLKKINRMELDVNETAPIISERLYFDGKTTYVNLFNVGTAQDDMGQSKVCSDSNRLSLLHSFRSNVTLPLTTCFVRNT